MGDKIEEGLVKGAINPVSIEKMELILHQMRKSICKIEN